MIVNSIETYLKAHPDELSKLTEGIRHFGSDRIDELIGQALSENKKLDFFYNTDEDLQIDKLSFRFIDTTQQSTL